MKKLLTLCLGLLAAGLMLAQEKPVTEPNYGLAEQFTAKKVSNMVFSLAVRPNWFRDSDRFWYQWKDSEGTHYYVVDAARGTREPLFDMESLAMQLSEIVKDPFEAKHIPIAKLKLVDDKTFTFEIKSTEKVEKKDKKKDKEEVKGEEKESSKKPAKKEKENKIFRFEYDLATHTLKDVTENDEKKDYPAWASISPDGTKAIYCKNYDLYWMDIEDIRKLMEDEKDSTVVDHRITEDGNSDFYYAGSDYRGPKFKDSTSRYHASGCWAPDSRHFATFKIDMHKVQELWVINSVTSPRPTLETYKYQMPGEPGPTSHLYVFDASDWSSKTYDIAAFKDQSVDILSAPATNSNVYDDYRKSIWLGDNNKFYITRQSRDQKRLDLCRIKLNEEKAETVVEERLNTYVESREPRFTSNGAEFFWWSERNGWANIYRYSSNGTLLNVVAGGAFHVEEVLAVDEKTRTVMFLAMGMDKDENPYNGHVYRVGFDGKGLKRIDGVKRRDEEPCNATVNSFSDDAKYFVTTYSRVDCAPRADLYDQNGRLVLELEEADFSLLLAAGYQFPTPFKVKAADGITDLYGYMYKPYDFDPNKKYPIIDYVYPGPQVEGNSEAWSSGFLRKDRLAQIGFIVITVGNRGGHPNRSKWYHNFGYGNLRDYGLEDQKYAIQQLASRHPWIDATRVGIHGHSGGGFMSTAAILKYPDFFKVAVSCAGNHDNSMYNRWWSEQHHGVLEEITAAGDTTFKYSIDKNQDIAKNLKGHLMLVHGDIDDNVHPGNTIRVVNALIKANKRFDMLILPGQRHGFGTMNEYFFWRMADYYSEWLLGSSKRAETDITEMNND